MVAKKISLDRAITEIARRLKEHIGSNGNSHLPVSKDANGFMTTELLSEHNEIFKQRKWVSDVDVLNLAPGFYDGNNLLNHPAMSEGNKSTWISNIDVLAGSGETGRKLILLTDSSTGARWYRTIHNATLAKSGSGWIRFGSGEVTLWQGSSYMSTPVTLQESIVNENGDDRFSNFYVEYQTDEGNHGRAYGKRYDTRINTSNQQDNNPAIPTMTFYETMITFPSVTTAVASVNVSNSIFAKSASDKTAVIDNNDFKTYITKIVGVI